MEKGRGSYSTGERRKRKDVANYPGTVSIHQWMHEWIVEAQGSKTCRQHVPLERLWARAWNSCVDEDHDTYWWHWQAQEGIKGGDETVHVLYWLYCTVQYIQYIHTPYCVLSAWKGETVLDVKDVRLNSPGPRKLLSSQLSFSIYAYLVGRSLDKRGCTE